MTTRDDARGDALELLRDEPYGAPSDVWALGVVLYETCAAGARPFETKGKGGVVVVMTHRSIYACPTSRRAVWRRRSRDRVPQSGQKEGISQTGSQSVLSLFRSVDPVGSWNRRDVVTW